MLDCSFHLIANLIADRVEVAKTIIERTNLVHVIHLTSEKYKCSNKLFGTIAWLASALMGQDSQGDGSVLSRDDRLKLATIGAKSIQMIDDTIVADGCWLYYYAFDT